MASHLRCAFLVVPKTVTGTAPARWSGSSIVAVAFPASCSVLAGDVAQELEQLAEDGQLPGAPPASG